MAKKRSIRLRRLDALYKYAENVNSKEQRELVGLFLAIVSHRTIKKVVEDLEIKVPNQ